MRIIGWGLLWLLMAWLGYNGFASWSTWQGWTGAKVSKWETQYSAYTVYWLEAGKPLSFNIPANAEQIRLRFTAVATNDIDEYSIDHQVFDQQGQMITATHQYLNDRQLPPLVEKQLPERFFTSPTGPRARVSRGFFIDSLSQRPVRVIRLSLAQSNAERVAVRVAILERKADSDLPVIWQRMRRDKRAQMMEDNIYPPELVSEQQRLQMLKYSWLPLGPEGIAGKDHQQTILFVHDDIPAFTPTEAINRVMPMLAGKDKLFGFVNTPELGVAQVGCQPLDGSPLQWFEVLKQSESNVQDIQVEQYPVEQLPLAIEADGGLYQLRSDKWCEVTLFDQAGQLLESIAKIQRGFVVNAQQPLDYGLTLNSQQLQPLRLDIRGLNGAAGVVRWQLQTQDRQVLSAGELPFSEQTDPHERLSSGYLDENIQLGVKSSIYLMAPANATQLRLSSDGQPGLVNIFTRPISLPHLSHNTEAENMPQWFTLLPRDHDQLKAQHGSALFYYQPRILPVPPQTNKITSQWQALKTDQPRPTFSLMAPDHKGQYLALKPGKQQVELVDEQRQTIRATLIYSGNRAPLDKKVTVKIDQQTFDYWLSAPAGRINLPSLDAGIHTIELNDSVDWYLNKQAAPADETSKRIRQVYPITSGLKFNIEKVSDTEWLSFHYYPFSQQAHRLKLKLTRLPAAGVYQSHTIPIRHFAIGEQTTAPSVYLLNQPSKGFWSSQVIKFPLYPDLPAGDYQLQIDSDIAMPGYIQASYIKDNMKQIIRQYREVVNAD